MKAIFHFLIALFLSGSLVRESRAQISLGCPINTVTGLSDTVVANTTVSYIIDVVNTGTQDLFGSFLIYVAAMDSVSNFNIVDSFSHQPFLQPFAAGDTLQVLMTHDIPQSKFVEGNNTVVIWPVPPSGITTDSIFRPIYVIYFNSINENEPFIANLYPNPTQDEIQLVADEVIEEVRIFDLNGKLIATHAYHKKISLNSLPNGIYLFELKSVSGKVKKLKVIKS